MRSRSYATRRPSRFCTCVKERARPGGTAAEGENGRARSVTGALLSRRWTSPPGDGARACLLRRARMRADGGKHEGPRRRRARSPMRSGMAVDGRRHIRGCDRASSDLPGRFFPFPFPRGTLRAPCSGRSSGSGFILRRAPSRDRSQWRICSPSSSLTAAGPPRIRTGFPFHALHEAARPDHYILWSEYRPTPPVLSSDLDRRLGGGWMDAYLPPSIPRPGASE